MPSKKTIDEFLAQKHVAFVGVSRNPKQFANAIYRELCDGGRTLYPVNRNPEVTTIEGDRSYQRLADVPDPVDGVFVMVAAKDAADVVREAVARGIPRVWLHRGLGPNSVSAEAVAICAENGVDVVDGACPLMFVEPVGFIHRIHHGLARHRFAA
ncbi:MAG TPA: CoA-binding protein [Candidatus Dormibacteraeota bacterium]|jgi:predicted CoA-binding protein|nr:CoA-binding protein [Candidatus Dormibacteraeota bacterium]